ncbi:MAG TPA: CDP-alcohol phosphatidyltransferase family protein [Thermoanaerobaculia bacterium]|nr:CDP-alcohol phosphatidyltransferase family protein [Thermoanaerobaculia bacterium]
MNVWRTRLNGWLTPIAAASPISPNAISCLALGLMLAGAVTLSFARRDPVMFLIALPIVIVGGLLDAMDGVVARVQGRVSRLGDFLDHFFDRIADLSLLAGWILGASIRLDLGLVALILVSLHGYLGTQIEASFGERDYDQTGRGEFVLVLVIFPLLAWNLAQAGILHMTYGGLTIPEWATTLLAAGAAAGLLQRFRWGINRAKELR